MFNQLSHSPRDKVVRGARWRKAQSGLAGLAATNQCGLSVGANKEAVLQADVIKQRRVSPHQTHCGALKRNCTSAYTYLVGTDNTVCVITDTMIFFCSSVHHKP